MVKHISGWIIEGVVASGKTTFIKELQQILANKHPARTKVYISEHYTERVLENEKAKREHPDFASIQKYDMMYCFLGKPTLSFPKKYV
jgi:uridine kinase